MGLVNRVRQLKTTAEPRRSFQVRFRRGLRKPSFFIGCGNCRFRRISNHGSLVKDFQREVIGFGNHDFGWGTLTALSEGCAGFSNYEGQRFSAEVELLNPMKSSKGRKVEHMGRMGFGNLSWRRTRPWKKVRLPNFWVEGEKIRKGSSFVAFQTLDYWNRRLGFQPPMATQWKPNGDPSVARVAFAVGLSSTGAFHFSSWALTVADCSCHPAFPFAAASCIISPVTHRQFDSWSHVGSFIAGMSLFHHRHLFGFGFWNCSPERSSVFRRHSVLLFAETGWMSAVICLKWDLLICGGQWWVSSTKFLF